MPNIRTYDHPTVTYNGFSFSGRWDKSDTYAYPPKFQLTGDIVYDDAGRNSIYTRYTLTVMCVIFTEAESLPGEELGADLEDIHDRLSDPHQELFVNGIGLPFESDIKTSAWGVQPKRIIVDPIAGLKAANLVWTVEFCLPTGINLQKNMGAAETQYYALNWASSWEIDESGLTTRTVNGYYQIAGRVLPKKDGTPANIKPEAIADQFRESIEIEIPLGFRRLSQSWRESLDKSRLNFTIVDRQFDFIAFPVQCTNARGDFTVNMQMPAGVTGMATLSMELEVVPGIHRSIAVIHFLRAAFDRQQMMLKALNTSERYVGKKVTVIPQFSQTRVGLFDRRVRYQMTWLITGCVSDLMYSRELYDPIKFQQADTPSSGGMTAATHQYWLSSLGKVTHQRGVAGLTSPKDNDRIVNIADGINQHKIVPGYTGVKFIPGTGTKFKCPDLDEEASWLAYDVSFEFVQETGYTIRNYLTPLEPKSVPKEDPNKSGTKLPTEATTVVDADYKKFVESNESGYFMILKFKGMRAQHAPTVPWPENADKMKLVWKTEKGPDTVGNVGCWPLKVLIATQVWWSPEPFEDMGESGKTGFCDNVSTLKKLSD